jgi:hypothetical protein
MNRFALFVALCLLPVLAGAQAVRCKDPASGRILYTDQPCPGGELVVPRRSEAELAQDAASAAQAREAAERREALTVQREQLRLEGARQAEAARVPPSPARIRRLPRRSRRGQFSGRQPHRVGRRNPHRARQRRPGLRPAGAGRDRRRAAATRAALAPAAAPAPRALGAPASTPVATLRARHRAAADALTRGPAGVGPAWPAAVDGGCRSLCI